MNNPQIISLLRSALQFGGGILVSSGYISGGELETIIGVVLSVIALAWSIYTRRAARLVADAANQSAVESITVKDGASARAAIKAGADAFTINAAN